MNSPLLPVHHMTGLPSRGDVIYKVFLYLYNENIHKFPWMICVERILNDCGLRNFWINQQVGGGGGVAEQGEGRCLEKQTNLGQRHIYIAKLTI